MNFKFWSRFVHSGKEDPAVAAILADSAAKAPADTEITAHRGLIILFVGLGVFIVWAALAPLSQGVPVQGFLKVEGSRKTVQHLRGGIIESILVRDGEVVEENQPLIRLNDTQIKAQFGMVESKLIGALATEARLIAEQSNQNKIEFPGFLLERASHPVAEEAMTAQSQLMNTRRAALMGEMAIGRETISGLEKQVRGLMAQEQAKAQQLKLFSEELSALRPMYDQGFIPRTRMFELERAVAYLGGQRSEDLANIGRAQSQISELRLKILQSKELYQKEVQTHLAEIQRDVADQRERIVAIQDELDRVVLRSPSNGVVVDKSVSTIGGIISPGQKLMDIVPADQPLLIEVRIPTQLIDNVEQGLDADIHFSALDQFEVPRIPGRLDYVSADRLTDPSTGEAYFIGRISVKPESVSLLGTHKLQTGMPANVVIITGERSFLSYVLRPIVARLHFAFKER